MITNFSVIAIIWAKIKKLFYLLSKTLLCRKIIFFFFSILL